MSSWRPRLPLIIFSPWKGDQSQSVVDHLEGARQYYHHARLYFKVCLQKHAVVVNEDGTWRLIFSK